MFKEFQLLAIKLINRILAARKSIKLINKENKKNALISYVLFPEKFIPFYYKASHNNRYQGFLLAEYLKSKGYNVYVYDYLDMENIDYSIPYDLFIGHNISFLDIGQKFKNDVKKILLATGSEPNFGNEQQKIRIEDVNRRKNEKLLLYDGNIVPDLTHNYEAADLILLLGNNFVKETYPERFQRKITLINNVTLHPYFNKQEGERQNSFLFISSVGQVHRGLDLLLEVFSRTKYKLYILSAFDREKDFVGIYCNELYNSRNIYPVGFVSLDSDEFRRTVNDSDFVILPSCAEGQSSSVINLMAYGLIPVIPENVGVAEVDEIGVRIKKLDVEGVESAVQNAVGLTQEDFVKKKNLLKVRQRNYTSSGFKDRLDQILNEQNFMS